MQVHCGLGGKILPGRTNSTELVVAGFGGLIDEVLHSVLSRRTPRLMTESERGTVVSSS